MQCKRLWKVSPKVIGVAGLATAAFALLLAISLRAQPTGGRVITDITVTGNDVCKVALISFSFPIRYINHFPQKVGAEVRIQLKPLEVGSPNQQDYSIREAFSPVDDTTLLNNVIYEADIAGGPYLTLQFSTETRYTVVQGTDFRSVRIAYHASSDNCPVTRASSL